MIVCECVCVCAVWCSGTHFSFVVSTATGSRCLLDVYNIIYNAEKRRAKYLLVSSRNM